ncbi:MAG: methyltransferase domain-containing protein [Burkholderiales bacterium]
MGDDARASGAPAFRFEGEAARRVESMYLTRDVTAHRQSVLERLEVTAGDRVLDVGCGPGLLAALAADRTGPEGFVCGVDVSSSMLMLARQRCEARAWTAFHFGGAAALPHRSGTFTRLACTQVLEYVARPDQALAEFRRVLRPGGRVVLMDTDWESCVWASGDDTRMRRIVDAWDTHCPHPHLPRTLATRLAAAGFRVDGVEAFPMVTTSPMAGSYCAGMVAELARFAVRSGRVSEDDAAAWRRDLERRDQAGETFFSLNRFVYVATRQ